MQSRTIEIWVGIFVILGIVAILLLSMKVSHLGSLIEDSGYDVLAKFQNVGGLKVKAPVKMAGVRVGRVTDIRFDDERYEAIVTLRISYKYSKIPRDSSASVLTAGLLGEQYVGLQPGAELEYLQNKDELFMTQSALILEQLVGKFLFSTAAGEGKQGK